MSKHAMYPTPPTARNKIRFLKGKLEKGEKFTNQDQRDMLEILLGLVYAVDHADDIIRRLAAR